MLPREVLTAMNRDFLESEVSKLKRSLALAELSLEMIVQDLGGPGLLALPKPPEASAERPCPFCGKVVREQATRCGFCWKKLSPPR